MLPFHSDCMFFGIVIYCTEDKQCQTKTGLTRPHLHLLLIYKNRR